MEKPNLSRNSSLRLPIGFRFRPTDEELLVHYLKRKVCALPLPASVIPELDVFRTNPWDLPGDPREKRFFFSSRKEADNGKYRHSLTTSVKDGSGYWKAIGRHRRIMSPATSNRAVGTKRCLAFYQGSQRSNGSRTEWIMHEYCLVASGTSNPYPNLQNELQVGEWIVFCIHRKHSKTKNHSCRNEETRGRDLISPCIWDFAKEGSTDLNPPQASSSSSSCSSGITNTSCNELDQEAK